MSKKNYWVRSGTYAMLQRAAAFLFGFGSYVFLVRYYSQENFGIWTLFVLISSIVEMSRSAFIQNAFVKFFNEKDIDRPRLVLGSLFLNLASTIFFIVAMLVLIPVLTIFWDTDQIGPLVLWYCVTSLILVPLTQLNYVEQANHSFRGVFWSAVVRQGCFFCIVVITYFYFPDRPLTFYASMQSVSALAGLLVAWLLSGQYMPRQFFVDWAMVRKLFTFGKYILGTGVTSTIGKNADQIILGSQSHSTVAMYNAAVRIMNFIDIPSLSISNIVYPKIAERASREGKYAAGILYEKSVASILGIILPIILGILLFPQLILQITAGHEYIEAYQVLRIMVIAAILIPFNIQVGSAFEVIGKPQVSFYINLGSNILNIFLNLILIRMYGAIGAALALALTVFCIFAVSQVLLRRELNIRTLRVIGRLPEFYIKASSEVFSFLKRKMRYAS